MVLMGVVLLGLASAATAQSSICGREVARCSTPQFPSCLPDDDQLVIEETERCCDVLSNFTNCMAANNAAFCIEEGVTQNELVILSDFTMAFLISCQSFENIEDLNSLIPGGPSFNIAVSPECAADIRGCQSSNPIPDTCTEPGPFVCCNSFTSLDNCLKDPPGGNCAGDWTREYERVVKRNATQPIIDSFCDVTATPFATSAPPLPTPVDPCATTTEDCSAVADLSRCGDLGDDCCEVARAYLSCIEDVVTTCPNRRSLFENELSFAENRIEDTCDIPNSFSDDANPCFPASASVTTKDGTQKKMSDLQIGDAVQTVDGSFSEVYFFSHRIPGPDSFDFVRISTENGQTLTVSESHYLYGDNALIPARDVRVGTAVELLDGQTSVTAIERVRAKGLFNPHTLQGTVVVDGFKTSTYTTAVHPVLANLLLAPFRALYRIGIITPGFLDDTVSSSIVRLLPSGQSAA